MAVDTEEGADRRGELSGKWPVDRSLLAVLRWIEVGALGAGITLLAIFAGAKVDQAVAREMQLAAFDGARNAGADAAHPTLADQSLWSEGRIAKYKESLSLPFAPPLAVLRVPKIALEVPVLAGIDELTLNRAVGAIPGTAAPGESGNVGIAGHRDGYFRGLKDLAAGDWLEVETLAGKREYRVTSIRIVDPSEVEVLAPAAQPTLTLVTCYPFYFVGNAPQRFIVRAETPTAVGEREARQDR
jgi:sortase A